MLGEESFLPVNSEPTTTLDKCPCVLNNAMTLHGAWLPALCGNLVVASMVTVPESQHCLHRRCGQGLCEAARSDGRSHTLPPAPPTHWYLQWPFPWQPFPRPRLPLGTSDVWGARRREGRCHPTPNKGDYQGVGLVLPDTTGSTQTPQDAENRLMECSSS